MKILYHVTHKNNVASILKKGLLISYAHNQDRPYIWLDCEPSDKLARHVAAKHGVISDNMVWLQVLVHDVFCIKHPLSPCITGYATKVGSDISPIFIAKLEV